MPSLTGSLTSGVTRSATGSLSRSLSGALFFILDGNTLTPPSSSGGSTLATSSVSLASLLYGEDPTLGRLLSSTGVKVSLAAITTNTSTLIQSGKTVFMGVWCTSAGTAWTATVRDNPTSAAGGNTKGAAVTMAAGDPFNAILNGKGIICDTGLVIDTAGTTPGSLVVLYY